jgi:hypothetical protein
VLVPPGPWEPSDRAFIERLIDEAHLHPDSIESIGQTLAAKATPPDRDLFDRLEAIAEEHEDDPLSDIPALRRELEANLRAKKRRSRAETAAKLRVVRGGRG